MIQCKKCKGIFKDKFLWAKDTCDDCMTEKVEEAEKRRWGKSD